MIRVFALAGILACGHVQVRDARDDEAFIRARLQKWVEQFNSGDYIGAAEIWAPDLIGVIPGGPDDSFEREQSAAAKDAIKAEAKEPQPPSNAQPEADATKPSAERKAETVEARKKGELVPAGEGSPKK